MSLIEIFKEFLTVFENIEKCRKYSKFSKPYGNFSTLYEIF
jgi:hypothetical protein